MSMTILDTIPKAGRSYKVGLDGASDVSEKYQLTLSAPLDIDELPTSFTGVPAIGSAHPNRDGYYALGYDVSQPDGSAKHTLDITVRYGPADITFDELTHEAIEAVTEWGWDDGTSDKELVNTVGPSANDAPQPVVNSAGDPFDSSPSTTVPTPTFTKVIRTATRKSYSQYLCTVNDAELTIGDMTCPANTLLCTVAEKKLIGEKNLPYEYTIHLKYRSNIVPDGETGAETEIGWNVGIVDAGMREIDGTTNKLKLIQTISKETGKPATVTSPELLDGHGAAQSRDASGHATPIVLIFSAYKQADWPEWFYSEPPTPGQSQTNTNTTTNSSNGGGE